MPVEINDILHVLAHELRTPVGIAHGYVRLLLEGRLAQDADRQRALEQMQRALGRLTELSHESTALASWYEQDHRDAQSIPARALVERIASADYDWPVTVETTELPGDACIATTDAEALGRALVALVRATARELRGSTCDVQMHLTDGWFEVLMGPDEQIRALARGPEAPGAGALALERGGLGLALVHAAVVLDGHGGVRWTVNGFRQTAGVRLPLQERQQP